MGLVGRPELLFLDEPTAGFDPQARRDFHDLMRALADDDVTILLTTHDLDEAEKLADRILVLAAPGGPVTDLEVRRASLEEAYLALVRRVEGGAALDEGAIDHIFAAGRAGS